MYKGSKATAAKAQTESRTTSTFVPGQILAVDSLKNKMTVQTPRGQMVMDMLTRASGGAWDRFIPNPGTPVILGTDVYERSYFPVGYYPKMELMTGGADPLPMSEDPLAAYGLGGLEVAGTGQALYADTGTTCRKINTGESDSQSEGGAFQYRSKRGTQIIGAGPIKTLYSLDRQRIQSTAPLHKWTTVGHQQGLGKNGLALGDEMRFGTVWRPHPLYGNFREIPIRDTAVSASKQLNFAKEYLRILRNAWDPKIKMTEPIPPYLVDLREGIVIDDFGFPVIDLFTGQPSRLSVKYFDRLGGPLMLGVDAQGNITINQTLNTTALGLLASLKGLYMLIEQMVNIATPMFLVNGTPLITADAIPTIVSHVHEIAPGATTTGPAATLGAISANTTAG